MNTSTSVKEQEKYIEKIKNAEVDELLEIPEMTIKAAENVYAFFHMQNNDKES